MLDTAQVGDVLQVCETAIDKFRPSSVSSLLSHFRTGNKPVKVTKIHGPVSSGGVIVFTDKLGMVNSLWLKPYVPPTRKVRLVVTQKDMETAEYSNPVDCPVARALRRIVKKDVGVSVGIGGFFSVNDKGHRLNEVGQTKYTAMRDWMVIGNRSGDSPPKTWHAYVELPVDILR